MVPAIYDKGTHYDIVRNMAKDEGIPDIKTEILIDVKSIIESIIEYATQRNIDLIVIGIRGRTGSKRFFNKADAGVEMPRLGKIQNSCWH
jgi:hypothetical protein